MQTFTPFIVASLLSYPPVRRTPENAAEWRHANPSTACKSHLHHNFIAAPQPCRP